ncbi:S-adenosylmethionine uptake transporter [Rhizobium sp. BK650]|uniref:DMT family transporter n=1 Tax=Rhizobium sp. BK650 TaxID=2586990 RepID=UPI00160EB520|nr:DMT family transporter [Rhizobium sp. BK650]MBB3659309.1 S-adenosylmethionine uptake transporter [Rhizobium sp. BK650]
MNLRVGQAAGNTVLFGMLLMLLGDFLFSLNDAMGKWLVASFAIGQVLVIRSLGSFFILAPMIVRQGPHSLFRVERLPLQILRVILTTGDVAFFYAAVAYLPLADVMTFYMAGPIYVAALSHFFLGETIGWRRWLAVILGFAGVVIALRPSAAMLSLPSVFGLIGSLSFALTLILGRRLRQTNDATLVTWQTVGALVTGMILSIADWRMMSALDFAAMLSLGVIAGSAHLMITRALKLAPASLLAPLQYSLLLWAIVFGYIFFGELPDIQILIGSVIIVLAGLFIFHRKNLMDVTLKADVPPDGH